MLRLVARIQGTKAGTVAHANLRRTQTRKAVAATVNTRIWNISPGIGCFDGALARVKTRGRGKQSNESKEENLWEIPCAAVAPLPATARTTSRREAIYLESEPSLSVCQKTVGSELAL